MGEDRVSDALRRIERALGRIEQAAARAPQPDGSQSSALTADYQLLRSRVEEAVAQLDRLIESGGQA